MPTSKRKKKIVVASVSRTAQSRYLDKSQSAVNKLPQDDPHLLSGNYWGELRIFLAVAKAKSFSRAAEELCLSRPTLSNKMKRLQDMMGAQLFVVTPSGIHFTQKGKELTDRLLLLDQNLFELSRDLKSESREAEGIVKITCTEALTGLFIVPGINGFNLRHPKIHFHLSNPVSLTSFNENQTDVFIAFGSIVHSDLVAEAAGYFHLIAIASRAYLKKYGPPTRTNLQAHYFVDAGYYASKTPAYASWHHVMNKGNVSHQCDNSYAYALLVKDGAGIGLLGNFTLADPNVVPVGLDVHVRLPIFIIAKRERLQAKPVRIAFDWLREVFSPETALFSPQLNLDALPRQDFSQSFDRITADSQMN
jgi:DNA-binding transcriptional LysR family regulator